MDQPENALLSRARGLAGVVEGEAMASEAARTLSAKCVESLRDSDLLLAFLPRELGGEERAPVELFELVEEIARQDGSAGWCFGMNGFVGGLCAASLPEAGIERVFSARPAGRTLIAGGFPPQGRCDREGEGWRVSGHFRFGSGIRHADHIACTVVEFADDQPVMDGEIPRMRSFVVPRDAVRIDDNWHVAGLAGTGSCDYHLDDQWLPDAISFLSSQVAPLRGKALYRIPMLSLASASHTAFALGVARRALEEITAQASGRLRLASAAPLAERGAFQQGFARVRTRWRAARALAFEAFGRLAESAALEGGPLLTDRAEVAAATTHAYETALDIASFAMRGAGGAALFRENRLQRCQRDIQAGSQHIVASDETWERMGQLWLGVAEPRML